MKENLMKEKKFAEHAHCWKLGRARKSFGTEQPIT